MQCLRFQPPSPWTGCVQTLYPAGSCDCCIGQVGNKIEGTHWPWYVQGATPVRPAWGWGVGEGSG